jgi:DNA-binding NarL/FixJ family response regulator
MQKRIKILIADDHRLVAESLKTMLELREASLEVVGIAADGLEACALAQELEPEVVLMDIRMPNMDGIEATARIRRTVPGAKVLALTTFDEEDLVLGALKAGALGYVLKDISTQELVAAVLAASRGESPVSPRAAAHLVRLAAQGADGAAMQGAAQCAAPAERLAPIDEDLAALSERERQVLVLAAEGLSTQEMADKLNLSKGTVKNYLSRIYEVLGLGNRADTVWYAIKHGLIDTDI